MRVTASDAIAIGITISVNTPLRIDAHVRVRIVPATRTGHAGANASAARPRIRRPRNRKQPLTRPDDPARAAGILEADRAHHLCLRRDVRRLIGPDEQIATNDGAGKNAHAICARLDGAADVAADARRVSIYSGSMQSACAYRLLHTAYGYFKDRAYP